MSMKKYRVECHKAIWTEKNEIVDIDNILKDMWNIIYNNDIINYKLTKNEKKRSKGKYKLLFQLNPMRKEKKRKSHMITSIKQEFNPNVFNFNKISNKEFLFKLETVLKSGDDANSKEEVYCCGTMVVNTSPICPRHFLLIPFMSDCLPQVLTYEGIFLATSLVHLSLQPMLRLGFNSLGAQASVNHYHFHAYYLADELPIERANFEFIQDGLAILKDYFVPGFLFELQDNNIEKFSRNIKKLVDLFMEEEICHNLFITKTPTGTIRACLWARDSAYGIKQIEGYAAALCEFAGHVVVYDENIWDDINEDDVVSTLNSVCVGSYNKILSVISSRKITFEM